MPTCTSKVELQAVVRNGRLAAVNPGNKYGITARPLSPPGGGARNTSRSRFGEMPSRVEFFELDGAPFQIRPDIDVGHMNRPDDAQLVDHDQRSLGNAV